MAIEQLVMPPLAWTLAFAKRACACAGQLRPPGMVKNDDDIKEAIAQRKLRTLRERTKKGSFLPRGMTAVFAVAKAPVSVDTLVIP